MTGDALLPARHIHCSVPIPHPHLSAGILPRHRVAAALPRYVSVPCHLAQLFIQIGVRSAVGRHLQAPRFGLPTNHDPLVRRPMHPLIGHLPDPRP